MPPTWMFQHLLVYFLFINHQNLLHQTTRTRSQVFRRSVYCKDSFCQIELVSPGIHNAEVLGSSGSSSGRVLGLSSKGLTLFLVLFFLYPQLHDPHANPPAYHSAYHLSPLSLCSSCSCHAVPTGLLLLLCWLSMGLCLHRKSPKESSPYLAFRVTFLISLCLHAFDPNA